MDAFSFESFVHSLLKFYARARAHRRCGLVLPMKSPSRLSSIAPVGRRRQPKQNNSASDVVPVALALKKKKQSQTRNGSGAPTGARDRSLAR